MGSFFSSRSPPPRRNLDGPIVNSIIRSLNEIQTLLSGIEANKRTLLINFREWEEGRRRTLSIIQECQDELDKIHVRSSVGRAVGSGTSLMGNLATVAGFGLTFHPVLSPIGAELMRYGPMANVMGVCTEIASSLAGKGFSAKVIRRLKQALEEDKRLTENLLPWFRRATELENLLTEVFDCCDADGMTHIFTCLGEIVDLCNKGERTLSEISDVLSSVVQNNFSEVRLDSLNNARLEALLGNASSKVMTLLLGFCQNIEIRRAVRILHTSFLGNPDLFEIPKVSNFIVTSMIERENALSSVISLTIGNRSVNWTQGMLQGILVFISVYSFLSAVEDIREGKSKYSEIIFQTKNCLSEELETLTSNPLLSMTNFCIFREEERQRLDIIFDNLS